MLGIEYFRNIVMVVKIVLNNSNSLNFDISLCYNQYDTNTLISNLIAISLDWLITSSVQQDSLYTSFRILELV